MCDRFCPKKRRHAYCKDRIVFGLFVLMASVIFGGQAMAIDSELFGRPLIFKGYINQGIQFGIADDHYDTMGGFQQALMEALLETEFHTTDDIKVLKTFKIVYARFRLDTSHLNVPLSEVPD
jgi:hypothetical protein